ncbi:MAG: orotate phosphoribosyltransferase-like protein [Halobacteria archaeon]
MKNIEDLKESARQLKERGLESGEIADELNISRATANWLLTHTEERKGTPPGDIHLDWSPVGSSSRRLTYISKALADLLHEECTREPDAVVGIAKAGVPIATLVAQEFESDLIEYTPRKQKWSDGDEDMDDLSGSLSRNFSDVEDRDVVIVDDVVTTGTTMKEAIKFVDDNGGNPLTAAVVANKTEKQVFNGVKVGSLIHVVRVD